MSPLLLLVPVGIALAAVGLLQWEGRIGTRHHPLSWLGRGYLFAVPGGAGLVLATLGSLGSGVLLGLLVYLPGVLLIMAAFVAFLLLPDDRVLPGWQREQLARLREAEELELEEAEEAEREGAQDAEGPGRVETEREPGDDAHDPEASSVEE